MNIAWTQFTPGSALAGGALIGLGAALLLLGNGRIAGISGIVGRLVRPEEGEERGWRLAFLLGLLFLPLLLANRLDPLAGPPTPDSIWGGLRWYLAGLLVGWGTRWANGCTSGHGVCGLARGSGRSLAAVATFMGTAVLTVWINRHLLGSA